MKVLNCMLFSFSFRKKLNAESRRDIRKGQQRVYFSAFLREFYAFLCAKKTMLNVIKKFQFIVNLLPSHVTLTCPYV